MPIVKAKSLPIKPGDQIPWCRLPVGHRFNFLGVTATCLKTGERTYQEESTRRYQRYLLPATINVVNLTEA